MKTNRTAKQLLQLLIAITLTSLAAVACAAQPDRSFPVSVESPTSESATDPTSGEHDLQRLTANEWTISHLVVSGEEVSVFEGAALRFSADGESLAFFSGCNESFGSTFKVGPAASLEIIVGGLTKIYCGGSSEQNPERDLVTLLSNVSSYQIDESGLRLSTPPGDTLYATPVEDVERS